jgi:hypothetical protein
MIDDLVIIILAAGEPDLRTLASQGDYAIALCLAALEGRVFAGRKVVRTAERVGQNVYAIEILDPQIHIDFETGLTAQVQMIDGVKTTTIRSQA